MDTKSDHAETHGSYLVTFDLGEKVEGFRHVGLETPDPDSEFFGDFQRELVAALTDAFGGNVDIVTAHMRDIADEVIALIGEKWGKDPLIVSTCPEIAYSAKGSTIEVNRLVDTFGKTIGIGPRPGRGSLFKQVAQVRSRAEGRPVILAEDGIFTGSTLQFIIDALSEREVKVGGIAAGFSFHAGDGRGTADFGVPVATVREFGHLIDWVPDHDFFPFVPGCGKVLGVEMRDHYYPFYDERGHAFGVPYLAPFGPGADWASIPEDAVNSFSGRCIQLAIELFEALEKMNGRSIAISDILGSRQRVTTPITVVGDAGYRSHRFPDGDFRVTTFLAESL